MENSLKTDIEIIKEHVVIINNFKDILKELGIILDNNIAIEWVFKNPNKNITINYFFVKDTNIPILNFRTMTYNEIKYDRFDCIYYTNQKFYDSTKEEIIFIIEAMLKNIKKKISNCPTNTIESVTNYFKIKNKRI